MPLKEFSLPKGHSWQNSFPWGGGHTTETDPTRKGWRLRVEKNPDLAVIGQRGIQGCASVMPLSYGLDVAIYDEMTPNEVSRRFRAGERLVADAYIWVGRCPGWALRVIDEIEAHRNIM